MTQSCSYSFLAPGSLRLECYRHMIWVPRLDFVLDRSSWRINAQCAVLAPEPKDQAYAGKLMSPSESNRQRRGHRSQLQNPLFKLVSSESTSSSLIDGCKLELYSTTKSSLQIMFSYLKLWGAVAAGTASHSLVFIRGEYHSKAPALLLIYLASYVLVLFNESEDGFPLAVRNATLIINAYVFALFASMVIYRTMFHPLRAFPGPTLARVSKLWHVYMVRGSQNHLALEGMREKYGNFVRTGKC